MTLSERLRAAITEAADNIRLAEIARAAGIHHSLVSRFAAGKRALKLDVAERVAEALGLRLALTREGRQGRRRSRRTPARSIQ